MPTETLYATSLSSGTVATSANALGAPDGTYTTDSGATSWTARFAMGDPAGAVASGTHTITVRVRKVGTSNPTVDRISLYAGPTLLATNVLSGATSVTSTVSQDISGTFAASLLSGRDLSTVEIEVSTTAAGGSPSARGPVQLDAVTWSGTIGAAPNTGTSSGSFDFTGSSAGNRAPKGTTTGAFALAGSSAGSRTPQGSTTGAYAFAGTAAGEVPPNDGTASGSYDFSGTAVGDQPPLDGTATGGFDFTGSAAGVARQVSDWSDSASATTGAAAANQGTASGTFDFTGSSVGDTPPNDGSASGGFDFAGDAIGVAPLPGVMQGTAVGAYAFSKGTVTGQKVTRGTASGGFALAGSSAGETPANRGTAAGTFSFTGTASGSVPVVASGGVASGTTAWWGSAHGQQPAIPDHDGSASGGYSFTRILATGANQRRGLITGWFSFVGTAIGEAIDPTYTFEPPIYQKVVEPPLLTKRPSIALTESLSVVRINGTFTQIKSPDHELLVGVEGEDYFLGGHVYTAVPQAVGLELQAAGYNVTEN